MPLYEPVAYYHPRRSSVKGKTTEYFDEEDEDDSDVEIYHDEKRGFFSSNSHFYENALSNRQGSIRLPESSSAGKCRPSNNFNMLVTAKLRSPIKRY